MVLARLQIPECHLVDFIAALGRRGQRDLVAAAGGALRQPRRAFVRIIGLAVQGQIVFAIRQRRIQSGKKFVCNRLQPGLLRNYPDEKLCGFFTGINGRIASFFVLAGLLDSRFSAGRNLLIRRRTDLYIPAGLNERIGRFLNFSAYLLKRHIHCHISSGQRSLRCSF